MPFVINSVADMDRLIAFTQQHAPHRVPLLRAVRNGGVTLCELTRESRLPTRDLERSTRPKIVLIGDDDGIDSGPGGWLARPRLAGWARHAFIHATGGDVASYEMVLALALLRQQVVLVETGTQHIMTWHGLFARSGVATVNLVPTAGQVHPVAMPKGDLH